MTLFRKQLKENHVVNKTFNYSKGDVSLNFTLRIDIKNQLKDFKDILDNAIMDVSEEIERKNENG